MPRQARLDVPGSLHHIMIRGNEEQNIFGDRKDRKDFLNRMGTISLETGTVVYAWSLLPNQAHMLLRSGIEGLASFMRRLLTSYAIIFNQRHNRCGHLFRDRYKSVLCEENSFFQDLVRYIHLLPLKEKLVRNMRELNSYPWCGHRALVSGVTSEWHDRGYVLSWFGKRPAQAIKNYSQYLNQGLEKECNPDLKGGGLIRSMGGWTEVKALRKRKACVVSDARILGKGVFVRQILKQTHHKRDDRFIGEREIRTITRLVHQTCKNCGISIEELQAGSRKGKIPGVRLGIARQLIKERGVTLAEASRHLGVTPSALSKALSRVRKTR